MKEGLRKAAYKGIFSLEGDWERDLRSKLAVVHLLRFLKDTDKIPFIHKNVATRADLEFRLGLWVQKRYRNYPILSLNFHGDPDSIWLPEDRANNRPLSLDDLAEILAGSCEGRIIHFGACATLDTHGNHLNAFLRRTGALAVCGYTTDIERRLSGALDLLLFGIMQDRAFNRAGARNILKDLQKMAAKQIEQLGFRLIVG